MLKEIIQRPVLSTVISIILLLLGGISLFNLPITLFPDIAPPSVQVTATYPGANAEVVARSVATSIEEAVNGVEDMTYMTSNSSNDGSMTLTVYFKQGTDANTAAVNVQNRVSKATSQLPQEVVQAGISTEKVQNSMIMFVGISSDDPKQYDELFLQNYLKINIIPEIQRISGVAQAQIFGSQDYSMRIWLKPDRLAANKLSPGDVIKAIQEQSLEAAPGRLGESSKETFEFVLKYQGKLSREEDYENIVIKSKSDGSVLRLNDIARVQFGSNNYNTSNIMDGKPVAGFALLQTAGSNAHDIITEVEQQIKEFTPNLPEGVKPVIFVNTKDFLDASIDQVTETLIIAFVLVFIVVFIFLQDLRSTLIPAIAVPVAIVGTFFFLQLFGFTINMLTLFALVLAIGIVVDDAIIVVEAVHTNMKNRKMQAREATMQSMSEISGAVVSITLVMAAVFIPVGFMTGPAGIFYRQFAFTLAIAIVISAINALTLSPALCAILLHDHQDSSEKQQRTGFKERFFYAFNTAFENFTNKYVRSIHFLTKRKWIALLGLGVIMLSSVIMIRNAPSGFIPNEDQGFVVYAVNTASGSSLDRTRQATEAINGIVRKEEAVKHNWVTDGLNIINNASASPYATGFMRLKEQGERGGNENADKFVEEMNKKVAGLKDINTFFFNFPTVQGFGNVSGFEFMLQDRTSGSQKQLGEIAQRFISALMKRKEIGAAFTTFNADNPQYEIKVDFDKAKQLGVPVSELMNTLQVYFGSSFVSDFNRFGKYYRVMAQADIAYRNDINSFQGIYIKNTNGDMVPANTLIRLERTYGPETVTRNNLFNAAMINGAPKPGYSTGDAIKAIEETARQILPRGYAYEWTGITREEKKSGSQTAFVFLMSVIFVYFLLAAQFESYILPFAIVLTIPTGIFGVFAFTGMAGIENNIYVQVGLIMLIGLLAKNAILIVAYAVQRRAAGMDLISSALEASRLRLRPILMTSFAFIVGMLPLVFAKGASAKGNHSIGISTVGGMFTGVLFGIFIIPVLYIIFQTLHEKIVGNKKNKTTAVNTSALILLVFSITSCKTTTSVYKKPDPGLPEAFRFTSTSDTASIANLEWREFFKDQVLQKLIEKGIVHNYDMQIALNQLSIAGKELEQAKYLQYPDMKLEVAGQTSRPSENSLNGQTLNQFLYKKHVEDFNAGLNLSWEADIWGEIKKQKEVSKLRFLQTYEGSKAVQTRIIAAIAQTYYSLLMLDKQLEVAMSNLQLTDHTLSVTKAMWQNGKGTSLGIQQTTAQKQSTELLITSLRQDIAIRENALSILVGDAPGRINREIGISEGIFPTQITSGVPAEMISRRPDVRQLEIALLEANAQVGISHANMYPSLRISANGGVNSFLLNNWFLVPASVFGTVLGGVTQPIFQKRQLKTNFEIVKIQREKRVLEFRQSVIKALGEVSDALAAHEQLKTQEEKATEQVKTLRGGVESAQNLYNAGLVNYLEVINAQVNSLQAELNLTSIRTKRLNSIINLYIALGGGWK